MGKSSKKASLAVAVAATPAPSGKPDKKGKRDAEEAIEKAASVKKQRRLVEEVVPQKEEGKKPKKALLDVPSKKKPETSSSEDDTSSESEEEVKVPSKKQSQLAKAPTKESSSSEDSSSDDEPVRKVAAPAKKDKGAVSKNGSAGALTKKGKLEGSSDSDSDEDEEDVPATAKVIPAAKKQAAPVAGSKKKEESSDTSESESESDEDNAPQNKAKVDESSDESDEELQPKKLKVPSIAKDIKKQSSSSEEDEDDSSEESSDDEPSKVQAKKPTQTSKESSSSEESSEEESEDEQPLKTPKKDKDVEMEDASLKSATEKQTATKSEKKGPKTPATSENQTFGSRTIFVGNLSYDVGRDDVEEFFKVAGEVVDVRLAAADDGQFKGYGHVEFASEEAVQKALEMNGQELVGRAVRLDVARERGSYTPQSGKENYSRQKGGNGQSQTIFVRGFDKSLEEDQIRSSLEEHFGSCGEITRVSIPKDYESGAPKGIAYMDFKDQDAFSQALELNGCELGGYTLTVDEAKPRGDNRDGGWSGGRGSGWSGGRGSGRGGRDGGGRNGARFGGRGGARGGGRGRGGGGRGRGGTPYKQTMGTASAGKKTTFSDD